MTLRLRSRALALLAVLALPSLAAAQSRIFAGSWGLGGSNRGRVYRWESGTTWTELSPPAGLGDAVWDLEWFDDALHASTHQGRAAAEPDPGFPTTPTSRPHGDVGRVWRNDGSGWVDISPPGGFNSAATSLGAMDGVLHATVDQDGLYRWDGGNAWTWIDQFELCGQSIVSDVQDGRNRLFMGQDNIDEFWTYDPLGLSACPTLPPRPPGPTCQEPPAGAVCSADCYFGSCIHAFAVHDDGFGPLVFGGAFFGRIYRWNRATSTFDRIDDVPMPPAMPAEHVQGLASYHGLLHVGLSDGRLMGTPDGLTASYSLVGNFGRNLPISELLTVPDRDELWIGTGGVPYRWARIDGTSSVKSTDGTNFTDRSLPGAFGQGVLTMLAVSPEVICDAGPDQQVECTGMPHRITLDGTGSVGPSPLLGYTLTYDWSGDFLEGTAVGPTPIVTVEGAGDHLIRLTVSAGTVSSSCSMIVRVVDSEPPSFAGSTRCLWPPNHRYRCFTIADLTADGRSVATDACDGEAPIAVVGLRSTQPEDELGQGDGSTLDDALFDADGVCVRQERQGDDETGAGRDYIVTLAATDAAGNVSLQEAILHVPHDQRPDRRCDFHPVDSGYLPHAALPLGPDVADIHEGTYPPALRPPR